MKKAMVINTKRFFEGTIGVMVERTKRHPLYKKVIKIQKKYMVHWSEKTLIELGTIVNIEQCRPISKTKTWQIVITEGKKNA